MFGRQPSHRLNDQAVDHRGADHGRRDGRALAAADIGATTPTTATSNSTPAPTGPTGPPDGPVPTGFVPVSVSFASADHGWVLGDAPCASPPCTSILRTRDGGKTWQGIPAPKATVQTKGSEVGPGITAQVARIRFADDNDGWAFGTDVYATHDGGGTWATATLSGATGDQVISLEAGGGTAWAVVAHCGANPDRCGSISLYRSAVGSDSWRAVGDPVDAMTAPGVFSGHAAQLVVRGGDRWVLAGDRLYGGPADQPLQPLSEPCSRFLPVGSGQGPHLAAADASHLDVMCTGGPSSGSAPKQLLGSTDGGRSWSAAGPRIIGLSGQDGLADNGKGVLLSAESSAAARVNRTTDDGASFTSVLEDKDGHGWIDLGFTTPQQAVAVSVGRTLYLSHDAGATWSPVGFAS